MATTKQDRAEFAAYLRQCTDTQVRNIYAKETLARRTIYAQLARAELERRNLTPY